MSKYKYAKLLDLSKQTDLYIIKASTCYFLTNSGQIRENPWMMPNYFVFFADLYMVI